jgi:hypothetical protein
MKRIIVILLAIFSTYACSNSISYDGQTISLYSAYIEDNETIILIEEDINAVNSHILFAQTKVINLNDSPLSIMPRRVCVCFSIMNENAEPKQFTKIIFPAVFGNTFYLQFFDFSQKMKVRVGSPPTFYKYVDLFVHDNPQID